MSEEELLRGGLWVGGEMLEGVGGKGRGKRRVVGVVWGVMEGRGGEMDREGVEEGQAGGTGGKE
ncbi:hypothetical protein MU748_31670, partial [Pseudomonas aeruginosa]|uniref:hypothetical protein n=1 Tax=Pseudomonas aeruginosa TaxID=287 RepID=UPI0024BEB042